MGLTDDALARLARRQTEERALVRAMTRRYETAVISIDRGREITAAGELDRVRVLAEWVSAPGWSTNAVADHLDVSEREVTDAVRTVRRQHSGGTDNGGAAPMRLPPRPARRMSPPDGSNRGPASEGPGAPPD
jgi:hypothetical protein